MVWQVAYLLASEETVNREFGAYDRIRDNFPKYVVSLDELDMSRITKRLTIKSQAPNEWKGVKNVDGQKRV